MPKKVPYPRLRSHTRKGKAGQVWTSYYWDGRPDGEKDTPLGNDYTEALRQWHELAEGKPRKVGTLQEAFDGWRAEVLPTYASAETKKGYSRHLKTIEAWCGTSTWDLIDAKAIKDYLKRRTAKTQGNREMALLSVVWGWAVTEGMVKTPFPLYRVGKWKNKEQARTAQVTDAVFAAVYAEADPMLRAAMDIATATGLRLTDVRTVLMPTNGLLNVRASKTGKQATFEVQSSPILSACVSKRSLLAASHLMLLSTTSGRPVSARMLREAFEQARSTASAAPKNAAIADDIKALFLRDMRKRASALAGDIDAASKLLQHSSRAVTERHYPSGNKLRPVR